MGGGRPTLARTAGGNPGRSRRSTTLILAPEHDQFAPPDIAEAAVADWAATLVEPIAGTDHSLIGAVDRIVIRTIEAFDALEPPRSP